MKSLYKIEKLKNYIEQIRGVSYKPSDISEIKTEGYMPLIRGNNIQNGNLKLDNLIYVKSEIVKERQILKANDIVMTASSGSKSIIGKNALVKADLDCVFGAFCKLIRCKNINPRYVSYFFKTQYYRNRISSVVNGSNINNLKNEHIDDLEIPITTIENQNKIVEVLDKAQELIDKRREQIEILDELVKSKFIEMFGIPFLNKENFNGKFSDVVIDMLKGPFGSDMKKSLFVEKGLDTYKVYVQINAIKKNEHIGDYYISKEYYDNKMHKFAAFPGDYLITCDGTLGKFIRLDQDMEEGVISPSLLKIKLNEDRIIPRFFEAYWELFIVDYLVARTRNTALVHLPSAKIIGNTDIFIPVLEEQKKFADFAIKIDKLKENMEKSLKELEDNFNSLMQKAFKGELF